MGAARDLAGSVQAGNGVAVGVNGLRGQVHADAAHGVVHGRDLAAGVPGTFGHLGVGGVVGDKAQLVLGLAGNDGVVCVDGGLQLRGVHAGRSGELLNGVGGGHVARGDHVFDRRAVGVGRGGVGVAQLVDDDPVGGVGLGEDGLAQRVACGALVYEALAGLVDEDAVAARGADVFHKAGTRRAAGVQLDVGQADELGTGGLGELEALALGAGVDVGAADGGVEHDIGPNARVDLLAVLDVGAEAARGDDDGLGVDADLLAVGAHGLHADNGAVGGKELGGVAAVQDGDAELAALLNERADVGVAGRRVGVVAALAQRAGGRADGVLEANAQLLEPVHGVERVVDEVADELGRARLVAALPRGGVVRCHGVLDALLLLALGVNGVECALGDVGGAAVDVDLLEHDDLGARLSCGNGSDEASATCADHGDVGVVGVLDHIGGTVDGLELLGAACLLGAVLDAAEKRVARDAGARHGVNVERLGLDDLMGERLERVLAHADGLVVARAVDVRQSILGERARHRERRVVAHDLRGIGARRVTGPLVGLGAPGTCETSRNPCDTCDDSALGERPTRACLHDEPP